MSGFGDEQMENTDTTFKDMSIEHEVDTPGMVEVYRKMMLIDLFQTHYGGWVSNLPLHIKVLMAVMLIMILAAIGIGIYFATVNWDRATNWMDKTFQDLMEKVIPLLDHFTQEEEEESNPKIKTIKQHSCEFESGE